MHVILKNKWFGPNGHLFEPSTSGGTIEMDDRLASVLPKSAQIFDEPKASRPQGAIPIDSQEKSFRKAGKEFDPLALLDVLKKGPLDDPMTKALEEEAKKVENDARKAAEEAEKLAAVGGKKGK